ncbi:hypothetical protein GGF46_003309 [Coemansia sp. RSA 552]|nr:hypothetical protein GGF46_003309 [Coemansia sp. RSA 552]
MWRLLLLVALVGEWISGTGVAGEEATTTHAPTSNSSVSCGPSSRYVVGYYQSWKRQSLMNVDWERLTHLHVAFGIPTDKGELTFDGTWFLPQLVREAHSENTKVSLSLGGWTGSSRFSVLLKDAHKSATLVRSIADFIDKHELDGIDIDWEYVGKQGSKCNKVDVEDPDNLLRFLRALRANLHVRFPETPKTISLAVRVQPFENQHGPLEDLSPFTEFVDYASIQAFDVNGPWSNTTGPSAPLEHTRNRGAPFSLIQAVDQWLAAKWPASKLIAGTSFAGHSATTVDTLAAKEGASMYTRITRDVPQGDIEDALWYDVCEDTHQMSGVWQYRHLRDQGVLKSHNTTTEEWIRVWDHASSTPWLYNPQLRRFVSFDDPESLRAKVDFVRAKGLKGMMTYSLHADYQSELLKELAEIGPLCRGPPSDSDEPEHASSSSETVPSPQSDWTPTPPFASLPTHSQPSEAGSDNASAESPSHSAPVETSAESAPAPSSEASVEDTAAPPPEAPAEPSASPAPASESASPAPASESASPAASAEPNVPGPAEPAVSAEPNIPESKEHGEAAESGSSSVGRSILFDGEGEPYMMVGGRSTSLPADMAAKLAQLDSATWPTHTGTLPPAIPVVDSTLAHQPLQPTRDPNKLIANVATNLFSTPHLVPAAATDVLASLQTTTPKAGFATTFFLPLDTTAESGIAAALLSLASSDMPLLSSSASAPSLNSDTASDPLATSIPTA